eukprot:TRINITY_DN28767_c0_g1_i2.p1 TRINITY_DN28767_c0_g1~~TRINITY_DN28767_c0_g1_i2.p1  ORF type:complete len:371 (+),score=69.48 TRINITY_DN28767_c0_g1_i2:123-1115(+)
MLAQVARRPHGMMRSLPAALLRESSASSLAASGHGRHWKLASLPRTASGRKGSQGAFAAAALLPALLAAKLASKGSVASHTQSADESSTSPSLVVVVGVSHVPGIGFAVAKKFAQEGMKVAIIGRQASCLSDASASIKEQVTGACVDTAVADATRREEVQAAIAALEKKHGPTAVLVYNVSARPLPAQTLQETSSERFVEMFETNVMGALHTVQAVIPGMQKAKTGTIIFTGATASIRGSAKFSAFAAAKMGLRGMAQALAKELNPEGIHVAHVVVDGLVDMPFVHKVAGKPEGRLIDTDAIAEAYWMLHCQTPKCFTFELDVRPHGASW